MIVGGFEPPDEGSRLAAIGISKTGEDNDTVKYQLLHQKHSVPLGFIRILHPNASVFTPIRKPKPRDWLACHEEKGQTFKDFLERPRLVPYQRRNIIYIQALFFFEDPIPDEVLAPLCEYIAIFFGMPVKLLPNKNYANKVQSRIHKKIHQVNVNDILMKLKSKVPADGFCLVTLTMCDLYPGNGWDFVYGQGRPTDRVGVYSIARHSAHFFSSMSDFSDLDTSASTSQNQEDPGMSMLVKSMKTLSHEICHLFGMEHCIYFNCLMNGSNNSTEFYNIPLFLCPVCLRKLNKTIRFDIIKRYRRVRSFCTDQKLQNAFDWLNIRLLYLEPK